MGITSPKVFEYQRNGGNLGKRDHRNEEKVNTGRTIGSATRRIGSYKRKLFCHKSRNGINFTNVKGNKFKLRRIFCNGNCYKRWGGIRADETPEGNENTFKYFRKIFEF